MGRCSAAFCCVQMDGFMITSVSNVSVPSIYDTADRSAVAPATDPAASPASVAQVALEGVDRSRTQAQGVIAAALANVGQGGDSKDGPPMGRGRPGGPGGAGGPPPGGGAGRMAAGDGATEDSYVVDLLTTTDASETETDLSDLADRDSEATALSIEDLLESWLES